MSSLWGPSPDFAWKRDQIENLRARVAELEGELANALTNGQNYAQHLTQLYEKERAENEELRSRVGTTHEIEQAKAINKELLAALKRTEAKLAEHEAFRQRVVDRLAKEENGDIPVELRGGIFIADVVGLTDELEARLAKLREERDG